MRQANPTERATGQSSQCCLHREREKEAPCTAYDPGQRMPTYPFRFMTHVLSTFLYLLTIIVKDTSLHSMHNFCGSAMIVVPFELFLNVLSGFPLGVV